MDDSNAAIALNSLKKRKEGKRRKVIAKEIYDNMISAAMSRLRRQAMEKNGGRLPHRKMLEVLQGLEDNGAHMTRHKLN
jgi:hypothetical protein